MKRSTRTLLFSSVFIALIMLISFPGLFDWSNRIEPWVVGVPFVMFWHLFLALCIALLMAVWYFTDSINGDLDIEIEEATERELAYSKKGSDT
ncbi:hypothetical protein [Brevibacillus sp. NRS-1366]|uniref:hypothetical protein n=1 Tax=Brevibacillus sp. NRS-1366 TaxID=3233899 RepID=UPI003D21A7F3